MKEVTRYAVDLHDHEFHNFNTLLLADPTFRTLSKVDFVLGVAELANILKIGLVKGLPDEPIA